MSILIHRQGVAQSVASGGGSAFTTPLKMLQDIPANFPIPIHTAMFDNVTHNNAIFSNMQLDGGDLKVFADQARTQRLPLYVLAVDTGSGTEKMQAFTKSPTLLNIGDKVFLETLGGGGSETQPAAGDTYGLNNVWTAYERVIQFGHDGSNSTAEELTGNGSVSFDNNENAPSSLLNDWPAAQFNSNTGGDSVVATGFNDDPITWTASFLIRATPIGTRLLLQKAASGYEIELNDDFPTGAPANAVLVRQMWNTSDVVRWHAPYGASAIWKLVSVSYDHGSAANDPIIMINGVAQAVTEETPAPSNAYVSDATEMRFFHDVNDHFNGGLLGAAGQVRIAHSDLPESWETLVWNGFNSPASVAEAEALS